MIFMTYIMRLITASHGQGIGWTEVQCSVQLICVLVQGGSTLPNILEQLSSEELTAGQLFI